MPNLQSAGISATRDIRPAAARPPKAIPGGRRRGARGGARTTPHELADAQPDRIETVDIAQPEQVAALRDRLAGRSFDMLFGDPATANMKDEIAGEIATDGYARVLVTNALAPLHIVEACRDVVRIDGLIGIMSSGQGSITNNINDLHEVYRSRKAALNQRIRRYAARHAEEPCVRC